VKAKYNVSNPTDVLSGTWFKATVTAVNANGTYNVRYYYSVVEHSILPENVILYAVVNEKRTIKKNSTKESKIKSVLKNINLQVDDYANMIQSLHLSLGEFHKPGNEAPLIMGQRVNIYWTEEEKIFKGKVIGMASEYKSGNLLHKIKYDDGDVYFHDMTNEYWSNL